VPGLELVRGPRPGPEPDLGLGLEPVRWLGSVWAGPPGMAGGGRSARQRPVRRSARRGIDAGRGRRGRRGARDHGRGRQPGQARESDHARRRVGGRSAQRQHRAEARDGEAGRRHHQSQPRPWPQASTPWTSTGSSSAPRGERASHGRVTLLQPCRSRVTLLQPDTSPRWTTSSRSAADRRTRCAHRDLGPCYRTALHP
jgi:hypothetical protein